MESAFQFTNPSLTEIEFALNSDYEVEENKEVPVRLNISVNISRSEDNNEAVVSLMCEIGEKDETSPFWIKAEEKARFRWKKDIAEDLVEKLLNQNAPALLLSYVRPTIAQVTMASSYGVYNIPFINFTNSSKKV